MSEIVFLSINRKRMLLMAAVYFSLGLSAFLLVYYFGQSQSFINTTVINIVAVIIFLFFLVVSGTYIINLRNKEAGLRVDRTGIYDNLSSISVGLIPWKDINRIEVVKTNATKLILVHVKKPKKYIDSAKNSAVKRLLNQNFELQKTPICINAGILTKPINEVEDVLKQNYQRFVKK